MLSDGRTVRQCLPPAKTGRKYLRSCAPAVKCRSIGRAGCRRGACQALEHRQGLVISIHLPPPVMIESAAKRALVIHMLCWSWAMCFSAAEDLASAFERKRFEEVDGILASRTSTLAALKNAPEAAGIEFTGTPDDGLERIPFNPAQPAYIHRAKV